MLRAADRSQVLDVRSPLHPRQDLAVGNQVPNHLSPEYRLPKRRSPGRKASQASLRLYSHDPSLPLGIGWNTLAENEAEHRLSQASPCVTWARNALGPASAQGEGSAPDDPAEERDKRPPSCGVASRPMLDLVQSAPHDLPTPHPVQPVCH
jgi:hypothetical protein